MDIWEMDAHIIKTNITKDPRYCLYKSIQPSYPCPIHSSDSGDLATVIAS